MRPSRRIDDRTREAVIADARADLARHYRNDQEFRKQIARAHRQLQESQRLLRAIELALARFAARR